MIASAGEINYKMKQAEVSESLIFFFWGKDEVGLFLYFSHPSFLLELLSEKQAFVNRRDSIQA